MHRFLRYQTAMKTLYPRDCSDNNETLKITIADNNIFSMIWNLNISSKTWCQWQTLLDSYY